MRDFIWDPYALEFLGAQPDAGLYEQDLEQGLLNQLKKFLMELGKGFVFVAPKIFGRFQLIAIGWFAA